MICLQVNDIFILYMQKTDFLPNRTPVEAPVFHQLQIHANRVANNNGVHTVSPAGENIKDYVHHTNQYLK